MIIDVLVDCYLSSYQMIGMCVDMQSIHVYHELDDYPTKELKKEERLR